MADVRPRNPIAYCVRCGMPTDDLAAINDKRPHVTNGTPCNGIFRSALSADDWAACVACGGTGQQGTGACDFCAGWGKHLVRRGAVLNSQ